MIEGETFHGDEMFNIKKIKEEEKIDKIAYKYNPNYQAIFK